MYKSFVLPTIKYANVVGRRGVGWGTYDCDIFQWEKIHVDGTLCIQLVIGANYINYLYIDTA